MKCSFDNCHEEPKIKGMCKRHYNRIIMAERRGGYKKVGDFCKNGHKIEGDNAQFYMNHGTERVRCRVCNQVPAVRVKIGDSCKHGHIIAGSNLVRSMRDGKEFYRCRECVNTTQRNRRQRAIENGTIDELREREAFRKRMYVQKNRPDEYQKELARSDKLLTDEVRKGSATFNSLKYLKLGRRAGQASQALEEAFERARAKCYSNPGPYIDYEYGDEPSQAEAYKLCEDCPLMVECGRFAAAYRPPIGVWAGEVWIDGKIKK
jgi:hypothetical protein